ncbi:type II toxin-antitoxin system RelE/ParE family toxin [Marinivivus vitaminiproducens]|uniref:type II toxin-antitoxin system RelE/ParE family toxin n=1 Tax=Marinivivus vitaminiproducens TaxID=3035935 RepID=UPI0027A09E4B|nr:type II toxin-antitoxin system RelE/ParE family toxin [Geminicoccaceae bacterium SCSIO 64248]
MTRRITYTPLARDDLEAIADYIARDNPARALSFVRELRFFCRDLGEQARRYPVRSEFGLDVRGAVYRNYLVLYSERPGDFITIERVVHGARDLETLILQEPTSE